MDVLQLDISGRPQAWITPREAAVLYAADAIAWTLGDTFQVLRGGWQRATGRQSRIEVHPIVAVRGAVPSRAWRLQPALIKPKLFARDRDVGTRELLSSVPIQFSRGLRSNSPRIASSSFIQAPRLGSVSDAPMGMTMQPSAKKRAADSIKKCAGEKLPGTPT